MFYNCFLFYKIIENLVYQNNPFIIYSNTTGQSSQLFYRKGSLKKFAYLLKERLRQRRFPANLAKSEITPFL